MPFVSAKSAMWQSVFLLMALLLEAACSTADSASANIPAPVLLWSQNAPSAPGISAAEYPAIYPFLPSAAINTGAGVLIVSGKPFVDGNPDHECISTAQWLNARGLAAFILRYRGAPGNSPGTSVGDVTRALQYLRAHAVDFHLSATRIGVLGFAFGAELAAEASFTNSPANAPESSDAVARASSHPDFLALIYGASMPKAGAVPPPPTFLVGSTNAGDNLSSMIDLWNFLRSSRVRVPVEAHFFPKVDMVAGLAQGDESVGTWPELFYNWVRAYGFLTDQPRVAIRGSVSLNGQPLPHGYVIFTPVDAVGAGSIVAHVFNSTSGVAIGSFSVPAGQGPVPGRYRVDVRQNANRWLSNSFSADQIRDPAFGHARILSPSIDDQHSYIKVHPGDKDDLMVEIKAEGNADLKIEVFSK